MDTSFFHQMIRPPSCESTASSLKDSKVSHPGASEYFAQNTQYVSPHWPSPFHQDSAQLSLTISNVVLPSSPALDVFLRIAWDGVGTINRAWDTCDANCGVPVLHNRLCGGSGLSDFSFSAKPSLSTFTITFVVSKKLRSSSTYNTTVNTTYFKDIPNKIAHFHSPKSHSSVSFLT